MYQSYTLQTHGYEIYGNSMYFNCFFTGKEDIEYDDNITKLYFHYSFNQQLPSRLENGVLQPNLPKKLTYMKFVNHYNQPLPILPSTLTHLHMSYNFNHSIDHLPDSITHLTLGMAFNKKITKFPANLQHLTIDITHISRTKLPLTLESLHIISGFANMGIGTIINRCNTVYYLTNLVTKMPIDKDIKNRLDINKHNHQIKHKPFYDS